MEFFARLQRELIGYTKATLIIMPVDGKLTIGFIPEVNNTDLKDRLKPLQLSGTAEEMDAEFFQHVTKQLKAVKDFESNIGQVEEDLKKLEEEKKQNAKVEKKKEEDKPAKKKIKPSVYKKTTPKDEEGDKFHKADLEETLQKDEEPAEEEPKEAQASLEF